MERARRNEKDEISVHVAVLGGDSRALDERQQVSLNTLTAGVGPAVVGGGDELVNFVDEDDSILLHCLDGLFDHIVVLEQLLRLDLLEDGARLFDFHLFLLRFFLAFAKSLEPLIATGQRVQRDRRNFFSGCLRGHLDIDFVILHLTLLEKLHEIVSLTRLRTISHERGHESVR